jgi:tetraacyldisaccharide 4'-kinase
MTMLSAIYRAAVGARNALYDRGTLAARCLKGPVVSVGNLSVGGAGKTPFVLLLGELLHQRGIPFDVLSRGYGRETSGVAVVDPHGSARQFGDEPLLLARKLAAPVVLGEERYAAGVEAEKRFGERLHILDDGFQHRALARDFDIVLVTPDDARDKLLPSGRLREPLSALTRADAVVLMSGAKAEDFPVAGKSVWKTRRGIVTKDLPSRPVAFCGIARPQSFFLQLRTAGVEPAAQAVYPDHHRYTGDDIRELLILQERSEADGFVTTEKDMMNLAELASRLQRLGIVVVRMELVDADAALDTMLRKIEERRRKS